MLFCSLTDEISELTSTCLGHKSKIQDSSTQTSESHTADKEFYSQQINSLEQVCDI